MSRPYFKAPKLPQELLDKIQPSSSQHGGEKSRRKGKKTAILGRKEQRKVLREQKKSTRSQTTRLPQSHLSRKTEGSSNDEVEDDDEDEEPIEQPPKRKITVSSQKLNEKIEPAEKKIPVAVQKALDQDDAEIAFLEKKLGIRGKKRGREFEEDGFEDILGGIDEIMGFEGQGIDSQDQEWLRAKRRKAETTAGEISSESDQNLSSSEEELDGFQNGEDEEHEHISDSSLDSPGDLEITDDEDEVSEDDKVYSDEFDEIESEDNLSHPVRVRENPYKPPIQDQDIAPKYIPPSLRTASKTEEETITRIRRQLQGYLNRLSESNMLSILRDIEGVFASNARQHVIETLIDLLMGLICDRSILSDTFIILHAAFIAAVYKIFGTHFGAQFLERFASEFKKFYEEQQENASMAKQTSNLIALIADVYTFQVVTSNIMFDYIKLLLSNLTDLNAELLLRLIKSCGPQLRHDSPTALKDIIVLMQKEVAEKGESNLPVRTKFMIETIMNLKNNRVKNIGSSIATESIVRLKKSLGSLNSRNIKGNEPLGVGLKDIQQAGKGGKWWLVGASWKAESSENKKDDLYDGPQNATENHDNNIVGDQSEGNDLQLAKQLGMNTAIRQSIFMTIMDASDYKDANLRLRRLNLNKAQQFEIPRVVVLLTSKEETYNPYYRLIAEKMCSEHRFRMAFQFNLWNTFRRLGEKDHLSEESMEFDLDEGESSLREIVNLAKMYGELVASLSLPITILKV
jgi:nucleolar MIF4G domain-containing protein 1